MEPHGPAITAVGCPDPGLLCNFDLGMLPAPDLDAVSAHLATCDRCREALGALRAQLDEDHGIVLLRSCLRCSAPPDEPAYAIMEAGAVEVGTTTADSGRPAADCEETEAHHEPARAGGEDKVRAIGPYELRGRIGQGGMGVVYRAYQVRLDRMVALKMILGGSHAGDRTLARFLREGRAIARLHHPNVVQVYDLGESDGYPYFSMELIDGGNLQARLERGPFELREAAELVRVVAEAVDFAHRQGVVHRDLKPANILLDASGTPKVTDFGLAKLLDTDADDGGGSSSSDLTESGSIVGTAGYMAPEQAEGRSDVGAPADVHALGAILYALLTGHPPFVGETKFKTLELVRTAQPVPPTLLRKGGVPFGLQSICLKCLEKSPARRYASAQELADDLGRWLNDERPRAIPGLLTRARRGARRNRAAALVGATCLAAGLALLAVGLAAHLKSPDFAIKQIEVELARGRAVTLIGQTGEPAWSRWLTGKSKSQRDLAEDRAFRVTAQRLSLVELLPDPQCDRYRFSAQVRHETGEFASEVGLFVGLTAYPGEPRAISNYFFTQLAFNDRVNVDLGRQLIAEMHGKAVRPADNAVLISTLLYAEGREKPLVERRIDLAAGPRFKASGNINIRWHDLEAVVTPEGVEALWDGQPFSVLTSVIQEETARSLIRTPPRDGGPLPPGIRPVFRGRGGLGLLISRGSAAFRDVKVTPL
jgi:eukaryotic-like serine/threonine-protein kinase